MWLHMFTGGSIPMWASHRVTKAAICRIPEGTR
jgi:hypothetical protein